MDQADLSVIVTHFKTPDILNECIHRVVSFLPHSRVIVVDSGNDGTVEKLNQTHPDIETLTIENHSMANTVNEGLKQATSPYILQMNADVYLEKNSVKEMLRVLKKKKVGMVGPVCYNSYNKLQNQGLLYYRYYRYLQLSRRASVRTLWLSGCCNLIKREALEQAGGLNSSLRFYNEDIEWGWRFNKAKWETRLVNTAVTHLGGSSTPDDSKFLLEGYRGAYKLSQWYKPRLYQMVHKYILQRLLQHQHNKDFDPRFKIAEQLLIKQDFDSSPFGKTLNELNPDYKSSV